MSPGWWRATIPVGLATGTIQFVLAKSSRSSADNLNISSRYYLRQPCQCQTKDSRYSRTYFSFMKQNQARGGHKVDNGQAPREICVVAEFKM